MSPRVWESTKNRYDVYFSIIAVFVIGWELCIFDVLKAK